MRKNIIWVQNNTILSEHEIEYLSTKLAYSTGHKYILWIHAFQDLGPPGTFFLTVLVSQDILTLGYFVTATEYPRILCCSK